LRELSNTLHLSLAAGELMLLTGNWYVTHSGLLRIAQRRRCAGIHVEIQRELSDPASIRWVAKATVFRSAECKGFTGYGDAEPGNVSALVHGAELRIAETRAVNRALRKAYGIGLCSIEELGSPGPPTEPANELKQINSNSHASNGHGQSLRDRLRIIVRQYQLDPAAVKAYAADFCEVDELRNASKDQVAKFILHLDELAQNDRTALVCLLNGYTQPQKNEAAA
jgi:hypothetical protein